VADSLALFNALTEGMGAYIEGEEALAELRPSRNALVDSVNELSALRTSVAKWQSAQRLLDNRRFSEREAQHCRLVKTLAHHLHAVPHTARSCEADCAGAERHEDGE
jgi:hypothetical protein